MITSSIANRAYAIDTKGRLLRFKSLKSYNDYVQHSRRQLKLITRGAFAERVSRKGRSYQWVGTRFSGMKQLEWRSL